MPIQRAADHGALRSFCYVPDQQRIFGSTRLDDVVFSRVYWWPGAIHEGNGVRRMIIDEHATREQRDALIAIESSRHGGLIWEISAAVAPTSIEPLFAPITFRVDRDKRRATVGIPGIGETNIEPIKNLVTGEGTQGAHCVARRFRIQGSRNG